MVNQLEGIVVIKVLIICSNFVMTKFNPWPKKMIYEKKLNYIIYYIKYDKIINI